MLQPGRNGFSEWWMYPRAQRWGTWKLWDSPALQPRYCPSFSGTRNLTPRLTPTSGRSTIMWHPCQQWAVMPHVNHSLHFVDLVSGVHTQNIESYWCRVKTDEGLPWNLAGSIPWQIYVEREVQSIVCNSNAEHHPGYSFAVSLTLTALKYCNHAVIKFSFVSCHFQLFNHFVFFTDLFLIHIHTLLALITPDILHHALQMCYILLSNFDCLKHLPSKQEFYSWWTDFNSLMLSSIP